MATTEQTRLKEPHLFPEIEGLDDYILQDLAGVQDRCAIAICRINLPPGEVFRMVGEQYGIYILTTGKMGGRFVRGVRTEREDGLKGRTVAIKAIKMVMSVFVPEEPRVIEFSYSTTYLK